MKISRLILFILLFIATQTQGQIGINTDSSSPDESAMLDVSSTEKGLLIPRMTTAQRTAISSPATGLLVFDTTTNSFWFYNASEWVDLSEEKAITVLADEDDDTKIQVEKNADEDIIRFDVGSDGQLMQLSGGTDPLTPEEKPIGDINGIFSLEMADMDKDGDMDAVGISSDELTWYENDGSQNFTEHIINNSLSNVRALKLKDYDNDGEIDILISRTVGEIDVYYNDGNETFASPTNLPITSSHTAISFDVKNLNSGSIKDIAGISSSGTLFVVFMYGSQSIVDIIDSGLGTGYTSDVKIQDLDYDGDKDLIVSSAGSNKISMYENVGSNNSPSFTESVIESGFNNAAMMDLIDMNGDGFLDIIACASGAGDIAWFANDGAGNFTKYVIDDNFANVRTVRAGDIDGDGDVDVAACNYTGNVVAWWDNDGSYNFTKNVLSSSFQLVEALDLVDVDGDGDLDVVAGKGSDGVISWWDMEFPRGVLNIESYVGIRTDSPESELDVNGAVTATHFVGDGSGLTGIAGDEMGAHTASQNLNLNGNWISNGGATEGIYVESGGDVGIGTGIPVTLLELQDDIPELRFTDSKSNASFVGAGLGKMSWYSRDGSLLSDYYERASIEVVNTNGSATPDPLMKFSVYSNNDKQTPLVIYPVDNTSGRVLIGDEGIEPQAPLHVNTTSTIASFSGGAWMEESSGAGSDEINFADNTGSTAVSIYASGSIVADGEGVFVAATVNWSDERIKDIQGISNSTDDLKTLSQIEVTDYERIHGGQAEKKVIAQQLYEVFPQAVSFREGVIPSIYEHIEDFSYDATTQLLTINTLKPHGLVARNKIDFYTELKKYGKQPIAKILSKQSFQVKTTDAPTELFVYGKWVDDVHVVDYDAISMLHVSATQEQQRIINAQQKEIERLKANEDGLAERLERLEALLEINATSQK